jgi:hypothetical protein
MQVVLLGLPCHHQQDEQLLAGVGHSRSRQSGRAKEEEKERNVLIIS